MSQNQSYFWQTTRHNVFLKRSAKLQMFLALMAVLTYSTICLAEIEPANNDNNVVAMRMEPSNVLDNDQGEGIMDAPDILKNNDVEPAAADKSASVVQAGFLDAFTASISVILFTELGDKTFFIAAIMAMRHPRLIVFLGAISALALMTVLSVVFGMAATIIPKIYTYYVSTALFAIFGLKMIYDGYVMKDTDAQEELEEVQSDLRKREDELMRATRDKYEETDLKRKNSNSDKEDDNIPINMVANEMNGGSHLTTSPTMATVKHPQEMQHRQRKQNSKLVHNSCDISLNGGLDNKEFIGKETMHNNEVMFHSSPALSQRTTETQIEVTPVHAHRVGGVSNGAFINGDAATIDHTNLVQSATMPSMAPNTNENNNNNNHNNNLNNNTIQNIGNGTDAAQTATNELNSKRLERDVTSALVKDPESGVVRKNSKKSAGYLTMRVMMQAFTMTFLAEWGDRSQLTTIILGASKNAYGVVVGGVLGHAICTGLAVVGGRIVATRISVRTVTILGGIVFLGFAAYALIMRPDDL